ncbi:MAG: hypothetical protein KJO55_09515 [Gammaproteobacteria bacterium]|nr:hypothetical protein [Gammaproteobacteria bacterium]
MNKLFTSSALLITGVALAGVALACPGHEKSVTTAKASPVAVQSPGKQVAAIDVSHRFSAKPALGVPVELQLEIDSRYKAPVVLQVQMPAALGGQQSLQRELQASDSMTLTLVPQLQGRHYVKIVAMDSLTGAARVLSIPVQIGERVAKLSRATISADGEAVVSLPSSK